MNNSSPNRSHGRMPSDEQMESMLRDFFRLEAPVELNHPFQKQASVVSVGKSPVTVVMSVDQRDAQPRSRKIVVAIAITALAFSLVVFVKTPDGSSGSSPVVNQTNEPAPQVTPTEDLMLVSPEGDLGNSGKAVGEDGVTLEETDTIELKAQPQPRK